MATTCCIGVVYVIQQHVVSCKSEFEKEWDQVRICGLFSLATEVVCSVDTDRQTAQSVPYAEGFSLHSEDSAYEVAGEDSDDYFPVPVVINGFGSPGVIEGLRMKRFRMIGRNSQS